MVKVGVAVGVVVAVGVAVGVVVGVAVGVVVVVAVGVVVAVAVGVAVGVVVAVGIGVAVGVGVVMTTAAPLLADECSRLQERVRVLEAALRPFADRAADYDRPVDDPGYPIEPDYRPKEQRTRRLLIGDLRAARAALEGIEVE